MDDDLLRYRYLRDFDRDMQLLDKRFQFLPSPPAHVSRHHDSDKLIAFERGGLVFVFNLHPTKSYVDYRIGVEVPGEYKIALNTDSCVYLGHGNIDESTQYFTTEGDYDGRRNSIRVYIPARVGIVLCKVE